MRRGWYDQNTTSNNTDLFLSIWEQLWITYIYLITTQSKSEFDLVKTKWNSRCLTFNDENDPIFQKKQSGPFHSFSLKLHCCSFNTIVFAPYIFLSFISCIIVRIQRKNKSNQRIYDEDQEKKNSSLLFLREFPQLCAIWCLLTCIKI